MIKLTSIIFGVLLCQLISAGSPNFYALITKEQSHQFIPIETQVIDGIRVNKACEQDQTKCFQWLRKKIPSHSRYPLLPETTRVCLDLGGSSTILYDDARNQYSFCSFEKKFLADSWDLAKFHKGQKK